MRAALHIICKQAFGSDLMIKPSEHCRRPMPSVRVNIKQEYVEKVDLVDLPYLGLYLMDPRSSNW